MKQSRTRLAAVIADATLAGDSPRYVKEVAAYLLAERRTGELDSILRDVQADWQRAGHVEVLAYSVHELSAEIRRDITERMRTMFPNAKTIVVTPVIDPDAIGGVRLRLSDRQLDMTARAQLNRFKQLTTHN